MSFLDEAIWRGKVYSSGWRQVFGPVAPVVRFSTPDEAVDDAPDTPLRRNLRLRDRRALRRHR